MTMRKKNRHLVLSFTLLGLLAGCSNGDSAAPVTNHHEPTHSSPVISTPAQPIRSPTVAASSVADPRWVAELEQWREQRQEELLAPHGLASLIGIHWFTRDTHYVGKGPNNSVRLEVGPDKLGLITRRGGEVWFTPETVSMDIQVDEKPITDRILLQPEGSANPTIITFDQGQGAISLIRDGQRAGLRLTHARAVNAAGLKYWPINPQWRVTGAFLPHPSRKTITLTDAAGYPATLGNPGTVEFNHNGQQVQMEIFSDTHRPFFTIFFDLSGNGTRLNSRYLDFAPPKADGRMVLDFNRSYNPPCAFSHSIACLLPPSGNYLNFVIEAGEKNYRPSSHSGAKSTQTDVIRSSRVPTTRSDPNLSPTPTSSNWR